MFRSNLITFLGSNTNRAGPEQPKFKVGTEWLGFGTWKILTLFKVQFLSFPISTIEKYFGRIFQARTPQKQAPRWQSWKPGPDYLVLHPKQTLTNWGALLIISRYYSWKMFWSNFDDFPGPKNHRCRPRASKVVNRVQMTLFCTQNIPTLFGLQFLSFLVSTTENLFNQILATFPALDTTEVGPERVKCKTGPGWFCFELTV